MTVAITYIEGDATEPVGSGGKIVAHICNDVGAWGKGFVLAVSAKWPYAKQKYLNELTFPCPFGITQFAYVGDGITIANMVAQQGLRSKDNRVPVHITALQQCLGDVAKQAWFSRSTVHMPRIGCGLGGANWYTDIEPLVRMTLADRDIPVYVYDLRAT